MAFIQLRIAAAFALVTAGRSAFVDMGANTACRSDNPCVESASNPCREKYDVMTETTFQDCKTVCETLAASCTGIEFRHERVNDRCEVWKVPINHTITTSGGQAVFHCYMDNTTGGTDGPLYPYFELEMPTVNLTMLSTLPASSQVLVVAGIKGSIVHAFGATAAPSLVAGVTPNHVNVMVDYANGKAMVYLTPPAGVSPLVMYAVLRHSRLNFNANFDDNTTSIAPTMLQHMAASLNTVAAQVPTMLKAGATSTSVNFVTYSRRLLAAIPFTAAPTPAPAPGPTPAPTPTTAQRNISGAEGSRLAVLAGIVSAAAAATTMF